MATLRNPTPEQQKIIDAFLTGGNLVIEAGAGTGKTTTLKMLAAAQQGRRGLYVAYNRAIADDAKRDFPDSVKCATAHSLAFGAVGRQFKHRLNGPRVPAYEVAKILGINEPLKLDDKYLSQTQIARLAMETLNQFCRSAEPAPTGWHVPRKPGLDSVGDMAILRATLVPLAVKAWQDITSTDGRLRFEHDHYLKCQPPGTLITITRRVGAGQELAEVPIEQIKAGDKVVTWGGPRLGAIRRTGRNVTRVAQRHYEGRLVAVATASGASSRYTHDHICIASIGDAMDGQTVVYLMRKGVDYRIGRVRWRYGSQGNTLGLVSRVRSQEADAVWVLSSHESDRDAALAEALAQHEFGIPGWQFQSLNEAMPLAQFWAKAGDNRGRADACLRSHGRDLLYPLWEQGGGQNLKTRVPLQIRACNLMDGMRVCEVAQVEPDSRGLVATGGWTKAWQPVTVTQSPHAGPVHSIEVDVDHTYVADGIVTHNCWQLSKPRLAVDYVLLDEAQDANPVISAIVEGQTDAQRVLVGDRSQAIYGWRGAIDAMQGFAADHRLELSQSFRFGPAIAHEANKWLSVLRADLRLTGFDRINSEVGPAELPDAVLCRSNAEAIAQAMKAIAAGKTAALVGGGGEIRRLAQAAITLKAGAGTDHPELFAFRTWGEVQDYAENDPAGSDLKVFVQLIDSHGPDVVIDTVDRLVDERFAAVVVSTAHKAKGREWDTVKIAGDFREPRKPIDWDEDDPRLPSIPREDAMLAYVAVTRAKLTLDRSGLAWVDKYVTSGAAEVTR